MDRKKFGGLIQVLRKEVGLERDELAEKVQETPIVIRDIERGERKYISDELLVKLSQALRLTSREQREFFLASTGLDAWQASHARLSPQDTLEEMLHGLKDFRLPWLLLDKYLYMLALHSAVGDFYKLGPTELTRMFDSKVLLYNLMSLQFSGLKQPLYQPVGEGFFEGLAPRTMHTFRASTLKYRFDPDFTALHRELKRFPLFNAYWEKAATDEEDELTNHSLHVANHVEYGKLSFYILLSANPTPYGELYLALYLPADAKCEQVFHSLTHAPHASFHRLADWRI
jgi:transcriptional regulator with XRE-family HTH domain